MIFFVAFLVVFVLILVGRSGKGATALGPLGRLETTGVRGRALILQSSFLSFGQTVNGQRFDKRTMTLDIEIPGRDPYVSTQDFLVPRGLVEPVPGASLDVAVNPQKPDQILILGPGGFSGPWIRTGAPNPF